MDTTPRTGLWRVLAGLLAAVMALAALPLGSAAADDHDDDGRELPTIAEIAIADPNLSTLVAAVTAATESGPVDFLGTISDRHADLTVFAPTDKAFEALGDTLGAALADPSGLLTDVLLYHVLPSSERARQLIDAGTASTLLGPDVTITVRDNGVFINDSRVVIANVPAANGIVHVIDTVLLPPPPPEPLPTIAELAIATPELTTLVTALTEATNAGPVDFLGVVSDPGADLTVFAPTNKAFEALGDTLGAALADPSGLLTDVLLYHVLGQAQNSDQLLAAGTATTLLGDDITIEHRNGQVFINDSLVVIADIPAANGIVHVIDTVLLPPPPPEPLPTIAELAIATPELTTLVTALTEATNAGPVDFLGVVSDPGADLTVFAPTNTAFEALGDTLGAALADPSGLLTDVLLYHVLGQAQNSDQLLAAGTATTLLGDDITIEHRNGQVFINDSLVVIADIPAANGIVHVIDTVLLPPPPPAPSPLFDGAKVHVVSDVSGRYLDGDRGFFFTNVDTKSRPGSDTEWILEATSDGNWKLRNARFGRYLDADNQRRNFNVDLASPRARGTEWEITQLDDGSYLLRTVDFDRFLDYDRFNVDTSSSPQADDRWQITLVPGS